MVFLKENGETIFHLKRIDTEKHMWNCGCYRYGHKHICRGHDVFIILMEFAYIRHYSSLQIEK